MSEQDNALMRIASRVKLFAGMPRPLLVRMLASADTIAVAKGGQGPRQRGVDCIALFFPADGQSAT